MTSPRKQRARIQRIQQVISRRRLESALEDQWWDRIPAVGLEFGSLDFERLMKEDSRLGRGVFDPEVRRAFGTAGARVADVEVLHDSPLQHRTPI
jgi:hypothetical protein